MEREPVLILSLVRIRLCYNRSGDRAPEIFLLDGDVDHASLAVMMIVAMMMH